LADDSGLCVEALHGGPGVESAYYAGPQGDPAANLARLVADLAGVPDHQRAAKFVCTLALLGPDGHLHLFTGECAGRLARWPRGDRGFGYDPLFIPAGFDRTLGELDGETKNALSHRGRAWADCFAWLAARG
jgi:XTP/dITP diphosphohydrolase